MVRAVDKADAMLTLSALYNIGSHLPFIYTTAVRMKLSLSIPTKTEPALMS